MSVSAVETLILRGRRSLRLKASALRALVAVPLPSSLSQFFEGGGVLAGGGAAFGTGFLVKAAVALVAGVVATGVGGDRNRPAVAAAGSTPRPAIGQSRHRADGLVARPGLRSLKASDARIVGRVRARSAPIAIGTKPSLPALGAVQGQAPSVEGPATTNTPSVVPAAPLPSPVSSLTDTVEAAVPAVPASLPVQAPSLPPVQVDIPKIPGGIPLP